MMRPDFKDRETSLYLIQSLDNGGVYVGVSALPRRRWYGHRSAAKRGDNTPLYNSMRKYGPERHTLSVVEAFPSFAEALEAEQWWIAYLRGLGARVFNLTAGGDGTIGRQVSPERRAYLSALYKGQRGVPATPEARAKMSEARRGKKLSPQHRAAISEGNRGKTMSAEARRKLSEATSNRMKDPAQRARVAEATRARMTPEAREHLASLNRGRRASEETKRRQSEAHRARRAREGASQ